MLCIFQFGGVLPAQIGGSLVLPCLPNYPHPVKGIRLADIPCLPDPSILGQPDLKYHKIERTGSDNQKCSPSSQIINNQDQLQLH